MVPSEVASITDPNAGVIGLLHLIVFLRLLVLLVPDIPAPEGLQKILEGIPGVEENTEGSDSVSPAFNPTTPSTVQTTESSVTPQTQGSLLRSSEALQECVVFYSTCASCCLPYLGVRYDLSASLSHYDQTHLIPSYPPAFNPTTPSTVQTTESSGTAQTQGPRMILEFTPVRERNLLWISNRRSAQTCPCSSHQL